MWSCFAEGDVGMQGSGHVACLSTEEVETSWTQWLMAHGYNPSACEVEAEGL